jgi:hypothetical protein
VSASNSLVGGSVGDFVGGSGITPLSNGNYVVSSVNWDNPSLAADNNAGAVTWSNGAGGTVGLVSASNSLVGGSVGDLVGSSGITPLSNGDYVVKSPSWDNPTGSVVNAGAISYGSKVGGTVGLLSAFNSVRGTTTGGGETQTFVFDAVNDQLVVGRPADNIVSLFKLTVKSRKRIRFL